MSNSIEELIQTMLESARGAGHQLFRFMHAKQKFDPSKDPVFYSGPYWDDQEPLAAMEALITGKWLSSGEHVHKFEREFSKKFGFRKSVMVNSGSSANLVMIAALKKAMNWKNGAEIIVSSVGFPTTVNPVVQNGLKPVFVDITLDDLNWDLGQVERAITENTVAVFSSPVLGNPFDFDLLTDICGNHGIVLICDGCDSLGSTWRDKHLSEYGIASSCSFYPSHHISTGEGGMVSSKNEEIVDLARSFAWWGRDCYCVGSANTLCNGTCGNRFDKWLDCYDGIVDHKYVFANMGYNLKPLDMQGAIGLVQLQKFDAIHVKRVYNKGRIQEIFERRVPGVRIPNELAQARTSWFGVPIICSSKEQKRQLVAHLESNRIQTRNYFSGNLLMHPAYRHLADYSQFPNATSVLDLVFFVGCAPHYDENVFGYIDDVLSRFTNKRSLAVTV